MKQAQAKATLPDGLLDLCPRQKKLNLPRFG